MFIVMPKIPLLGSKIWCSITFKSGICPFFLKEAVNMGWGASRFIQNIYIYIYIYGPYKNTSESILLPHPGNNETQCFL